MRDLRDWYSYLERSVRDARPPSDPRNLAPPPTASGGRSLTRTPQARAPAAPAPAGPTRPRRPRKIAMPVELQQHLPIELGPSRPVRRAGRPPLTETRDEIIRRLLDPELTLHETAAILNLSKATLRRYTDQGKLPCRRTAGGQRRFKLSEVLALVLHQRQHIGEFEAALPARRAPAGQFALVGIAAQRGLAEIQDGRSFMEGEFGIQEAAYDLLARLRERRSSRPPDRSGWTEFDRQMLLEFHRHGDLPRTSRTGRAGWRGGCRCPRLRSPRQGTPPGSSGWGREVSRIRRGSGVSNGSL